MSTIIQIKRSANVAAPTVADLVEGELAYSQDKTNNGVGARLYIESLDSSSNEVIHIVGGKYYTDKVDAATSSSTANTLVQRDTSSNFSANVITANTFIGNISGTVSGEAASANIASFANALTTPRTISLVGDVTGSVSFDGTQNVSITTSANINSVALGTDTTGDYVANVLAGTGIVVTGQGGETATPTVALDTSGVAAATYGSAAKIPVITVDQYGRITTAANVNVAGVTSFTASGNSFTIATADGGSFTANIQPDSVRLGTDTAGAYVANLVAGTGISLSGLGDEGTTPTITNSGVTSAASGGYGLTVSSATGAVTFTNTGVTRAIAGSGISVDTNNGNVTFTNAGVVSLSGTANEVTVSGATGTVQIGLPDDVTIARNLTVTGNLNVNGNVVSYGVENLVIEDSLIQLANNNISADVIDIGFYGSYNDGVGDHKHAGFFRDASDDRFKLFQGLQGQDNLTSTINITGTGYSIATLEADLLASNANVTTALSFGNEKHQILPLSSSVLEVRGGLGDASGALSLAAGNYPTAYSKIYLESAKKISFQADEAYFTLYNDGATKLITMNTTHTAAVSNTTGALRIAGGLGMTGNIYAEYFNGRIDGGAY